MAFQKEEPLVKSEFWDRAYASMQNPFWSHKGLSADCPFCHAQSTSNKMKFLIFFTEGQFRNYSCFVCGARGAGVGGLNRLSAALGLTTTSAEEALDNASYGTSAFPMRGGLMASALGDDFGYQESSEQRGEVEYDIQWPPPWTQETEPILLRGIDYLESRGIKNVADKVVTYGLVFSEKIEVVSKNVRMIKDYPCVIAPMTGIDPEYGTASIIGFNSRYLGTPKATETKTIAMGGSGWKEVSLFGLDAIDPSKPLVVVEGLFSALSTPNSVATGGKKIAKGQLNLIAGTGAKVIVFALDPDVKPSLVAQYVDDITLRCPNSLVLAVNWLDFGDLSLGDPNDRGEDEMRKIIARTISKAIQP